MTSFNMKFSPVNYSEYPTIDKCKNCDFVFLPLPTSKLPVDVNKPLLSRIATASSSLKESKPTPVSKLILSSGVTPFENRQLTRKFRDQKSKQVHSSHNFLLVFYNRCYILLILLLKTYTRIYNLTELKKEADFSVLNLNNDISGK